MSRMCITIIIMQVSNITGVTAWLTYNAHIASHNVNIRVGLGSVVAKEK